MTLADGRYRLGDELGHGGMASVYLARDVELDRPVAVKVLARSLAREPGFRERFVREARMAARLSHPNVVQIFDSGEEDESLYIVMEHVPGRTLADELRIEGRVEPARAVDLALQVCAGLEHAHAAGLVHRDIKPQNLLLRDDGVVKITDFGVAWAAEATRLTQVGGVLGTAPYLAPEQASGEPVTAAADIYSLGVVLYELLTGRTPYQFQSLAEVAVKPLEEPVPSVREVERCVPSALEAVVMRCLARNPAYRPVSVAELARDLAAASPEPPTVPLPDATGVSAIEVGAGTPLDATFESRPARRDFGLPRPGRAAFAVLALLLAALVVAVVVSSTRGDDGPTEGRGQGGEPAVRAPEVQPVARSSDPAQQARHLSAWIREHTEG